MSELTTQQLLQCRAHLTRHLEQLDPFSALAYLARCGVHEALQYRDLAIADAYKALLLAEEVLDAGAEYHEQAFSSARVVLDHNTADAAVAPFDGLPCTFLPETLVSFVSSRVHASPPSDASLGINDLASTTLCEAQSRTAHLLATLTCFRSAYTILQHAIRARQPSPHPSHVTQRSELVALISEHCRSKSVPFDADNIVVNDLPDRGFVRREVYPWNVHEFDRMSESGLAFLNGEMALVAPKLQVKVTELPDLASPSDDSGVTRQLGVFAKETIAAGEQVLCERSLLTANMREHEPLCDACGSELPELGSTAESEHGPVPCTDCDDVAFCAQDCCDAAQESYHQSVCGMDIESIGKDVPAAQAADALYVQLMFRAMAMSLAQETHPLDLKEVKFIWGDFQSQQDFAAGHEPTLPFDFNSQVLQPLHLLEQLDISVFEAPNQLNETWVYNTLLAKFRGTASARISPRDGRPEVAAVHPLWCLANHACDPNVRWEWSGVIRFHARDKAIEWARHDPEGSVIEKRAGRSQGVQAGHEVLNHYVDIDLPVKDRREWGVGALGGACQCERCLWEAGESPVSLAPLRIEGDDQP